MRRCRLLLGAGLSGLLLVLPERDPVTDMNYSRDKEGMPKELKPDTLNKYVG